MKRVALPTQPIAAFFVALFVVATLALSGCSANTISGPDLPTSERVLDAEAPHFTPITPTAPSAPHNEGLIDEDVMKGGGSQGSSTVLRHSRN